MNLQQLEYVLEVRRCGSINKASQTLFVTQPALSLAIKDLEEELGFTLFVRSSRGIHPTNEGSMFLNAIESVVSQIDQIKNQYTAEEGPSRPAVLRISSSRYSFVLNALIKFYSHYFKNLKLFTLEFDEVDCQQVIEDVFTRKADIGIIHTRESTDSIQKIELSNKGIEYKFLFSSHSYVILSKTHPLASKTEIDLKDIMDFPQIRMTSRNIDYYSLDTNFNFPNYNNSGKNIFLNSRISVINFLSKSNAVFLAITDLNVADFNPSLVAKPIYDDSTKYNFYAIKLKAGTYNEYIVNFVNLLKDEISRSLHKT
jgi:DNA-binding transcriptional LysR family regulator